jgi:hypothetical protein
MPLLDTCLEKNVTLVDYECIAENGERKVAFGHWAGVAGAINSIHFLGKRVYHFVSEMLKKQGINMSILPRSKANAFCLSATTRL